MTEDYIRSSYAKTCEEANADKHNQEHQSLTPTLDEARSRSAQLLTAGSLDLRGNSEVRSAAISSMQRSHGNHAVQRYLAAGSHTSSSVAVQRTPTLRPEGGPPSWYGFGGGNKQGGYSFGGGYGVGAADTGEWWQRFGGDLPFGSGSLLSWGENNDKDTRYGAKGEVGAGKLEYKGDGWSLDGSAFGLGGEASAGSNGVTVGGGATIVGGSATVGGFNANTNTDTSTRFGLSAGPSFGLRGHWGDSDSDGHREIGMGLDLGIFSADIKTEDPLRTGMGMLSNDKFGPALGMLNDKFGVNKALGGQYLPSNESDKSNWTEDMLGWASGTNKPTTIDNAAGDSWKKLSNWWDS